MTLNANKCELIYNNTEDIILDIKEEIILIAKPQEKYLGQTIIAKENSKPDYNK